MELVVTGPATISIWYKSKPGEIMHTDTSISIEFDDLTDIQRIVVT